MDIVFCTDKNYIMPTGVLMTSICVNNACYDIMFHVVCNPNVTQNDKDDLTSITLKYGKKIAFYNVDAASVTDFSVGRKGQPGHITIATYYRLLLPILLPQEVKKVLYLDSDIIVRGDIGPLFDTDLGNAAVGAVADMSEGQIYMYNRLRYSYQFGYFNAGVLLINLEYWRKNNILGECVEFAKQYPERIKLHDQDILNYLLRERKRALPLTYNFQEGFLYTEVAVSLEKYEDEIFATESDPAIIHYTAIKPWFKLCDNPYRGVFLEYRSLTKWKDMPLVPVTLKEKLKKICIKYGILNFAVRSYRNIKLN